MSKAAYRKPVFRLAADPDERIRALAELLNDSEHLDDVLLLASLTDDIAREAHERIRLVRPQDRYRGEHAWLVMLPFARPYRSRFSDGSYGVWYAADTAQTAFAEKAYHLTAWLKASRASSYDLRQKLLQARIAKSLDDVRHGHAKIDERIYDPDSYDISIAFGKSLRESGSNGLLYDSVRALKSTCVAIFRPNLITDLEILHDVRLEWAGQNLRAFTALSYQIPV